VTVGFPLVLIGLTLFLDGPETRTDVVFFFLEANRGYPVLNAYQETGRLKKPGTGIAFMVDVDRAVGLESQRTHFRRKAEKRCIMLLSQMSSVSCSLSPVYRWLFRCSVPCITGKTTCSPS
jgi:hypothetical protein